MSYNSRRTSRWPMILGFGIPSLVVIAVVEWLWGPPLRTGLTILFLQGTAAILVVLALIVGVIMLVVGADYYKPKSKLTGFGALILVVAVVGGTLNGFAHFYQIDRQYVAEMKVIAKGDLPEFSDRVPHGVAVASSKKQMGDTTGTVASMKMLPAEGDHGVWSAPIIRRGFVVGYESVQQLDLPLYGAGSAKTQTTCDFDTNRATHRVGGALPHNSLDYMVHAATPVNVTFHETDVYAYCDGETPMVIVPLQSLDGFWFPAWNVYGAAIYNGHTDVLEVVRDTSDLPGPVYPISLAQAQRSALPAIDGDWWEYVWGRSGWVATDKALEGSSDKDVEDTDDPNEMNSSELSLRIDGTTESAYATSLTPRGQSTSVTAVAVVDSSESTAGLRNTLRIYTYGAGEHREANSTISQSIRSQYSWMPDWASGLTVFEVAPGRDGSWVASIGQTQSVVYRAVIAKDGKITLLDETGKAVGRAGGAADTPTDPSMPADTPVEVTPDGVTDLSKLTTKQLQELGNALLGELAKRGTK